VKLLARTSLLPIRPTYPWPTPQNYGKTGLTLFAQCEGLWFEACLINNQALMKLFQIQRLRDGAWEYEHECTYKRNIEERSRKYGCRGKAVRIIYPECVCVCMCVCVCVCVALLTQYAMRMRTLYYRLWPVWLYRIFPHYLINGTIFWKKSCRTYNV